MFLGRLKIGSYWVGSIWIGYFWVRIYSGRFLSVLVLLGKRNLDPKGTCKFSVWFRVGIFGSVSGQVKMPMPNMGENYARRLLVH